MYGAMLEPKAITIDLTNDQHLGAVYSAVGLNFNGKITQLTQMLQRLKLQRISQRPPGSWEEELKKLSHKTATLYGQIRGRTKNKSMFSRHVKSIMELAYPPNPEDPDRPPIDLAFMKLEELKASIYKFY